MSRLVFAMIVAWPVYCALPNNAAATQAVSGDHAPALRLDHEMTFERHQFVIERRNGQTFIDNQRIGNHPIEQQSSINIKQAIDLIEHFDGLIFRDDRDFQNWVKKLRGPRTYTYDLVVQQFEDRLTKTPLVLLPSEVQTQIDPSWRKWVDGRDSENAKNRTTKSNTGASEPTSETEFAKTIAASVQSAAQSLRVISGETSLWEVELLPSKTPIGLNLNPGRTWNAWEFNRNSFYVRTFGRTSDIAVQNAQKNNPGYAVGSVRRLTNRYK